MWRLTAVFIQRLAAIALVSCLWWLTGCMPLSPLPAAQPAPVLDLQAERSGVEFTLTQTGNDLRVDVHNPAGIGALSGRFHAVRPERLRFRLYLNGLEQITLTFGDTVIVAAATVGGAVQPYASLQQGDGPVILLDADSRFWMPIVGFLADDTPAGSASPAGGYYEVTAPTALLADESGEFRLEWIDFFR